MATVVQRRKGATYGKAHRRILVDAAFGIDELSQSPWDSAWGTHATHAKDITKQPIQNPYQYQSAPPHKDPKSRSPSTSALSGDHATYDSLPSDDEIQGHQQVAARKRRRLLSSSMKREALGGHEDQSVSKKSPSKSSNKGEIHLQRPTETLTGSSTHACTQNIRNGHRKQSRPAENSSRTRPQKPQPNFISQSLTRSTRRPPPGSVPQKPPRAAQSHATLSRPTNKKARPSTTPEKPSTIGHDLPVTPPRCHSAAKSICTTPRQQELWDRLLASGAQSPSPSQLNVIGLDISCGAKDPLRRSFPMRGSPTREETRPKRLIDLLKDSQSRSESHRPRSSADCTSLTKGDEYLRCPDSADSERAGVVNSLGYQTASQVHCPNNGLDAAEETRSEETAIHSTLPSRGLKVTYAQQRSYLTDPAHNEKGVYSLSATLDTEVPSPSLQQAPEIPSKRHVDVECEDNSNESQDSHFGAMRTIHELREAGGNARMVGELEAFFDELDESQGQRAATRRILAALVTKLEEPSNARLLVDKGLESRLFSQATHDDDMIISSLFAASVLRLVANCNSPFLLSQMASGKVMQYLVNLLASGQDLRKYAKRREANMSRLAQQEYTATCDKLLAPTLWRQGRPTTLSCRLLSLQCLEHLASRQRDCGQVVQVLPPVEVQQMVQHSIPESSELYMESTTGVSSYLAISTLVTYTSGDEAVIQALRSPGVLRRILNVLPSISTNEKGSDSFQIQTLRLYANMTNNVSDVSEAFAHSHVIPKIFGFVTAYFEGSHEDGSEERSASLDKGILSLGCLINIAEVSHEMRHHFLQGRAEDSTMLDTLMQIFVTNKCRAAEVFSQEESINNVGFGYVSVLVCYLCLSEAVRLHVVAALSEKSLKPVFEAVAEFLDYHRMIDGNEATSQDRDGRTSFVERVQSLLNELGAEG